MFFCSGKPDLVGTRSSGVSVLLAVGNDGLDDSLGLKVSEGTAGKRSSDLQSVNEDRDADHLVSGSLLEDSVVQWLVKDDVVLGLILDLSLRPLLLLGLSSGLGGGGLSGLGLLNLGRHS